MSLVNILLIVAGVGYVLVRRTIGDIVEIRSLLVLPLVLTGVGLSQLDDLGRVDVTGDAPTLRHVVSTVKREW